jgi:hypothetical protein
MWIRSGMRFDRNRAHSLSISSAWLSSTVMVVQLLALAEYNGTELRNCPEYVREWVNRESVSMRGEN